MKKRKFAGTPAEKRALSVFVKLMRASESFAARTHGHIAGVGLTMSQFGALEALYHLGPMPQVEIARKVLRSGGNMTMVIDNLERAGYVVRERGAEDRRCFIVRLTPAGEALIKKLFPAHARKIAEEMSVLTVAEQETLAALCRKLGLGGFNSE